MVMVFKNKEASGQPKETQHADARGIWDGRRALGENQWRLPGARSPVDRPPVLFRQLQPRVWQSSGGETGWGKKL